jgi:hypothetical protein
MAEKYLKWFPIDNIPFPLDLEKYQKDEGGLTIHLNSEDHADKILSIQFTECEAFCEISDEFKTKFWHDVDIDEDYPLFIVEKSVWLAEFHLQSEDNYRDLVLQHYAIWTTENWIDILASSKPVVEWIVKKT